MSNSINNEFSSQFPEKEAFINQTKQDLKKIKSLLTEKTRKEIAPWNDKCPSVLKNHRSLFTKLNSSLLDVSEELKAGNKEGWKRTKVHILKLAQKAFPFISKKKSIEWVTGTRSAVLIGMDQIAAKAELTKTPALVPTGILLNQNIVPFTGELEMGIGACGVNRENLSGVHFSNYQDAEDYAFDETFTCNLEDEKNVFLNLDFKAKYTIVRLLRLKIAALRLVQLGADKQTLEEIKNHLINNILPEMQSPPSGWEPLAGLIGKTLSKSSIKEIEADKTILSVGTLVGVRRTKKDIQFGVIREEKRYEYIVLVEKSGICERIGKEKVLIYNPDDLKQLAKEYPASESEIAHVRETITKPIENKPAIEEILRLLESEKALELDEQDKSYLEDNFPIVWGSTDQLEGSPVRSDIRGEICVKGILNLGSEIDLVFTKQKRVSEIQDWLEKRNLSAVTVMSFGTALFLQAQQNAKAPQ